MYLDHGTNSILFMREGYIYSMGNWKKKPDLGVLMYCGMKLS